MKKLTFLQPHLLPILVMMITYLSTNYNYGISMRTRPGMAKCRYSLENVYDTPHAVFPSVEKTVETKRNEAYNITLATVDEVTKPTQARPHQF
jgi:hypothetical protein